MADPMEVADPMVAALLRPEAYDHPTAAITLLETHISWVVLTGPWAYKIRKPVNFGFVDFSTAALRQHDAEEELRLNRRLAPELYRDLVTIHGPAERASLQGDGPPLDTAVRMRQFPQEALLAACLPQLAADPARGERLIAGLAADLAAFHAAAAQVAAGDSWGTAAAVAEPALANLAVLERCLGAERIAPLRRWTEAEAGRLALWFNRRRADGHIRECHGDLHLGNMVLLEGRITVFDCLEFSPTLRWIDPISDLAFLAMDLSQRGQPGLARLLLNRWLDASGDWEGLRGWRWYTTYRALVRAKVTALRLEQLAPAGSGPAAEQAAALRGELRGELEGYLAAAVGFSGAGQAIPAPALVITQGVSGSGKSHLARRLCGRFGWLQLRSDVERRRLWQADRYAPERSAALYRSHLPACADAALAGGWSVLVDATFLRRRQRRRLAALARLRRVRFALVHCRVGQALALRRLEARRQAGGDPSEADAAVLRAQWSSNEEPGPDERDRVLTVEAGDQGAGDQAAGEQERLAAALAALLAG